MTHTADDFARITAEAHAAATKVAEAHTPRPMHIVGYAPIEEGLCGFAWVAFPGNTAFGRWAKKTDLARKAWPSGLSIWVSGFGQSYERKSAYAGEYARVLNSYGILAYVGSRLD